MLQSTTTTFFFFNDTATTEIYTLSLHDALPIYLCITINTQGHLLVSILFIYPPNLASSLPVTPLMLDPSSLFLYLIVQRSEEHTSELQSRQYLVCRLLLEKKKLLFLLFFNLSWY